METVLSCIQPSGELHIGNYFGAVANWVTLQDRYRCIYGIVDLHAMTMPYDPQTLRLNTEQMIIDLLACGVNPDKSLLFLQSLVPEHTELAWILSNVCSYGELTRQTQFKDKSALSITKTLGQFVSAGLFTYPVLQAADILIYRAHFVPVGKDQEQHLELSRNIARRFNERFGYLLPEPAVLSTDLPKVRSLADPEQKMSKSLGPKHYIGLFESEEGVRTKVRAAVTDSGDPSVPIGSGALNLLAILRACGRTHEANVLEQTYVDGPRHYAALKDAVADAVVALTAPFRRNRKELRQDLDQTRSSVRTMSEAARSIAAATLCEARALVGLPPRA